MSKFSIGSRVVKPESGNHGTVVEVMPPRRGRQLYKVSWEGYISDELEVNLIPDCDLADPYERCIIQIESFQRKYLHCERWQCLEHLRYF